MHLLLGALLCLCACEERHERPSPARPQALTPAVVVASNAHAAVEMSESEILGALARDNRLGQGQDQLAAQRATSDGVRAYAARLAAERAALDQRLAALARQLAVVPTTGVLEHTLAASGEAMLRRLPTLRGNDFDREYVDAEVLQLANLVDAVDNAMLPRARSSALREALRAEIRPLLAVWLGRAREQQEALGAR